MHLEYSRPVLNPVIFLLQILPVAGVAVAAHYFPVDSLSLPALDSYLPVLCFSDLVRSLVLDPFPSPVIDLVPYLAPYYSGFVPVDLLADFADISKIHNCILPLYQWGPIPMLCDKKLVLLSFFDFDKMYFPDYTLL